MLGEGAFCTVYRAIDKETNEQIAVKVIKRKTLHKEGVELLKQEANLLQEMDHKNIVKFKHVSDITPYIIRRLDEVLNDTFCCFRSKS